MPLYCDPITDEYIQKVKEAYVKHMQAFGDEIIPLGNQILAEFDNRMGEDVTVGVGKYHKQFFEFLLNEYKQTAQGRHSLLFDYRYSFDADKYRKGSNE